MKLKVIFFSCLFFFTVFSVVLAEEAKVKKNKFVTIKGVVVEICKDGKFIIVNDKKVLVNKKFLKTSYLDLGDRVRILAKKTDEGLKLISIHLNCKKEKESPEGFLEGN
ncbi:MAG: hypothetical protein KAI43_02895 [Candidatus Aureabacteria bacterium]|nr:hypothetical protein [Candidatus Auribacterota bacterium]